MFIRFAFFGGWWKWGREIRSARRRPAAPDVRRPRRRATARLAHGCARGVRDPGRELRRRVAPPPLASMRSTHDR